MLVDGRYIGIVDTLKLISSNSFVAAAPRKKKTTTGDCEISARDLKPSQ